MRIQRLSPVETGSSPAVSAPSDPASPLARMWHESVREDDADYVIHVLLGLGPHPDGGPLTLDSFRTLLARHLVCVPRFSSVFAKRRRKWGPLRLGEVAEWVPVRLDLEQHVREVDLTDLSRTVEVPQGAGRGLGAAAAAGASRVAAGDCVLEYVERHSLVPLRKDIPLWELHILRHPPLQGPLDPSSLQEPQQYTQTLLWRVHHSIGDGVAIGTLLARAATTATGQTPKTWFQVPERYTKKRTLGQRALWTVSYIFNSACALWKLLLLLLLPADPGGGLKAPSVDIRQHQREIARLHIPMEGAEGAKAVARASGGTLNDLLLCLLATAVHWWRQALVYTEVQEQETSRNGRKAEGEKHSPVEGCSEALQGEHTEGATSCTYNSTPTAGPSPSGQLPRAMFMSNIRSLGLDPETDPHGLDVPLGTRVGFCIAELPEVALPLHLNLPHESVYKHRECNGGAGSGGESDGVGSRVALAGGGRASMVAALQKIRMDTDVMKHSFEAWFMNFFLRLTCWVLGPTVMYRLVLHVLTKVTTGLSNLPGPTERLFLGGCPVLTIDQFLSACPVGATVHAVSYAGTLFLTLTADPETVKAEKLRAIILSAWEELH